MILDSLSMEEVLALTPEAPQYTTTRQLTEHFGGETTNGPVGFRVRRRLLQALREGLVFEARQGRMSLWQKLPTKPKPEDTVEEGITTQYPTLEEVLETVPFFPERATTLEIVKHFGGTSTISPLSNRIRRRLVLGLSGKKVFTAIELGVSLWWRRGGEPSDAPKTKPVIEVPAPSIIPSVSVPEAKLPQNVAAIKTMPGDIRGDMLAVLMSHIGKGEISEGELIQWGQLILNTAEVQFTETQLRHLLKLVRRLNWRS